MGQGSNNLQAETSSAEFKAFKKVKSKKYYS